MDFDLAVIGSGPGGYVAAIRAAQLGKKVAIIERAELGGVCLNWGCIPTKALLRSAEVLSLIKNAKSFGISVDNFKVDFSGVIKRSRSTAERLSRGVSFLMKKNKIETISGTAKIVDNNTVAIALVDNQGSRTITAANILIATGARARELPGMEIDGDRVLDSRHAMVLKEIPESIAIVGAGAIGVEFGYFFNTFGSKVTLIEMLPHILPVEDEEISIELEKAFKKQKITIQTGTRVEKLERGKTGVTLHLLTDGQTKTLSADYVLMAIGVQGNLENLGLEELGITLEKGWIKTNAYYQTNVPGVYAIGDIIGPPWLAHVASREGILAVEHLAGHEVIPLDYNNVPGCTYCLPQVASIGYTEKAARDNGYSIKVGRFPLRANGKALALGESEGFVKIIYDEKYGELLGCHIIGPEATELITEIALARTLEATHLEVLQTIHPHPTLTEIIAEATGDAFGEAIHI